jgi:hypothetical protein
MWWWCALASARPLLLETTTGARVEVLPRTRGDLIELAVYDNRAYLRRQVATWRAPGLSSARLDDVGGGVEFVMLSLREPDLVASVVEVSPLEWEIRLAPGVVELAPMGDVLSVEQLLARPPRRPAPAVERALLPLLRDARSYSLDPTTIRLEIPEPPPQEQHRDVLGEPQPASWDEIERLRALMPGTSEPDALSELFRRLGDAHSGILMPREAIYYYGRAEAVGHPSASALLARADAAFRIRDWGTARASCAAAAETDAPHEEVLLCLAVVSQATLIPAPAETGRALAQVATRRTSRFLAGDLLLRDGYADEAWPLLESAAKDLRGEFREVAWLAAGDAALLRGDLEIAQQAYHRARHGRLDDLLSLREEIVAMSVDGTRRWAAWVPRLTAWAESGGVAAPDAWYVLSQVHQSYGDPESEALALAQLWDLHPRGRVGADVGERLVDACTERVGLLARDGRDAELVEVWARCWRPGLASYVDDASLLGPVADAFVRLGFTERALAVHQLLSETLVLQGIEDFDSLLRLADFQLADEPEHALDTVAYTGRLAKTPVQRARLRLVEAAARAALGDVAGAEAAWAAVKAPAELVAIARMASARHALQTGSCGAALPLLGPLVTAAPLDDAWPGDVELRLAHCFVQVGRDAEALGFAALAVRRSEDPNVQSEARWLATAVGMRTGLPVDETLRSNGGTFTLIREEDERHRAFLDRTDAWSHAQ